MQNYHRHTSYSNIYVADSAAVNEDYAKRAVELGHKVISSVEHGWQGYYFETYELAKKYDLKFIFGAEAYWVKNRLEKDRTNGHIIMLAKNENGRRAINSILSTANEDGYYFRPRVDVELLLSLPADDVMITTACIAFWHYDDIEDILVQLHNHFKKNIFLEIQYHDTEPQAKLNQRILALSEKYGIEMIVGMDSHYIYPEQSKERDYILAAKNIHYEDEDGWFMDYPDDETTMNRFLKQGVFTKDQIQRAMDNTDLLLEFEDYAIDNRIFSKDIKLPSLYDGQHTIDGVLLPKLDQEQRNKEYSKLISKLFKAYVKDVDESQHEEYFDGVKNEVQVIKDTNMSDYFLIDYYMVKRALEKGGVLTDSGRGSSVGYFTNTLLGFSKVDRFQSPIKLYPERFISKSRILETKSLPDIDLNWGTPDIAAEAQEEILGKDHAYPMIAFGTCKKKSAFKLYARSQNMDFDLANTISGQIEKYDDALKYADDDEKDEIDIYDYVDEEYHSYIDASKKYQGIIMDKKKAPCAYLLYDGSIREEIGLIKCKSETTKKEYMTAVIDGAIAENYKFLKNDILKVDVVLLIDLIYKRIGLKHHTVNELMELVKNDQAVWDIYANGYTMGVNQVEKASTTRKSMKYKPRNVSELSAFIAAIRPAFKSMYSKLENREDFSYGIPAFDKILQTEELPQSFILYQEQTMNTLNYAGFPIDECYGIIKAIAKKHPEKVKPLKERFITGFKDKIMQDDGIPADKAEEDSARVWQIISDSCGYGFNSAHAYCMALDSLYNAYLKAHYPYEFYEVLLQTYSDKGKKDKVAELKQEMSKAFGIKEGEYKFGLDNRKFKADPDNQTIYPSLLSIKGLSQGCANDLYAMGQKKYENFYELWKDMKKKKNLNSGKVNTLIEIGYFDDFGTIGKIKRFTDILDQLYDRSQFSKSNPPVEFLPIIRKYSEETDKQYRKFDYDAALTEIWETLEDIDIPFNERLKYELQNIGYVKTLVPDMSPDYAFVQEYECKYKNPKLTLYRLADGSTEIVKVRRKKYDEAPINVGDIIKTIECSEEGRWLKDNNGDWQQDNSDKESILKKWSFVRDEAKEDE
jgi:DNA polymerase III alpha subunit|nr:MAG TPA: DNA polymerase III, alpha subunit [Caudoviricetes sp.]